MLSAIDALHRLIEGNRKFVVGQFTGYEQLDYLKSASQPDPQQPFSVILGCSDSRVPVEVVFNQGLMATELGSNPELLLHAATRTNVSVSADFLRHGSEALEQLIESGK